MDPIAVKKIIIGKTHQFKNQIFTNGYYIFIESVLTLSLGKNSFNFKVLWAKNHMNCKSTWPKKSNKIILGQ